jgi:hypothetical protein
MCALCISVVSAEEADALMSEDEVGPPPARPICFSVHVRPQMSTMMFTQMRTMTLVPHEPRWLPTECSRKS